MRRKWLRTWQRNEPRETSLSPGMRKAILLTVLAAGIFLFPVTGANASPSGGQIVSGSGQISQQGGNSTITQTTDKLGINWQNFNIAKGETVRFIQPSANSVALNRVLGSDASAIYGTLSANGKVFLINPNGILFAPGSQVNVGGIVASTMNMTDSDFQAGRYKLSGNGKGSVINQGTITATDGGYVALLGTQAKNEGIITANQGTVVLAGGKAATLDFTGDGLLNLAIDQKALAASAANSGLIQVNGGQVVMTAGTANTLAGTVVNNSGVIKAQSAVNKNGVIILDGGPNGTVTNSGILDVNGRNAGQTGGTIKVLGEKVELTGQAKLDASGEAGGGTILVGGNYQGKGTEQNAITTKVAAGVSLNADAITSGNGGKVVVWADDTTTFAGKITARGGSVSGDGGMVETSGKNTLSVSGAVNAGAVNGKGGSWLLDPTDYTIDTAAASSLKIALDGGTSVTVTSSSPGATTGNGDIHVNSALSWTGGGSLTLNASRNINVNAAITDGGAGNLLFTPGSAGNLLVGKNGSVRLIGGGNLFISGNQYTLINDLAGWNGMGLSGYYALNTDIDGVTAVKGTSSNPFLGVLEGLGHKVTININSGSGYVGLFGRTETGALLRNVGVSGSISGTANRVGGLIGSNYGGNIINCYSTVGLNMTNATDIGGLVGRNAGLGINTGEIINSYSTGTVASANSTNAGGLVGANSTGGSIKNSYSTIAMNNVPSCYYVGGLVGHNTGTVDNSYSTGDVTGDIYVGGLVGYSSNAIRYSFSTGKVTGNPADSGGIAGEYASGPDLISNCFWNTTVNAGLNGVGEGTTSGAIGKTADEMKMAATFASWDQSVWKFYDGSTIPLLKSFLQSVTVTANSTSMIYNGTIYNGSAGVTYSSPVTLSGTLAFTGADKNVGTYTITPTGLYTDQQGYDIQFKSGTLTVTKAPLTVTASGLNKVYNGLTDASVTYGGWISGDTLTASGAASFIDKNVGTAKTVNVSGIVLSGADAGNYNLQNTTASTTANITPADLTVTAI
ncbi:filamentous hemagglutinin family N-terminal domain-containing protein, partial [Sporomusa malonica]